MLKKLVPDHFLKNQNITLLYSCFFAFVVCQVKGYRNILKLSCRPLAFTSYKVFLKDKEKRSGTNLPASLSAWFLNENISLTIVHQLIKFLCLVSLTWRDLGHYVYCSCLLTRLWHHKFWNFENKTSFYDELKSIFQHF